MITLSNSKYGSKRKATIEGFTSFSVTDKMIQLMFTIQIMDSNNNLLDDKSVRQNRIVYYTVTNENRVNAQFDTIEQGGTGEYDYFWNLLQTVPLPTLTLQLAEKLKQRGIFD